MGVSATLEVACLQLIGNAFFPLGMYVLWKFDKRSKPKTHAKVVSKRCLNPLKYYSTFWQDVIKST